MPTCSPSAAAWRTWPRPWAWPAPRAAAPGWNAGIDDDTPFLDIDRSRWRAVIDTNLTGAFLMAQAVARHMARTGGGVILHTASIDAGGADGPFAAYNASKAGLLGLTRALALEWAPKVRVNHITAGLILTETSAPYYGEDGGASVARTIPMGRMAVPADIASACLYLASPLAGYVTGADLDVHGGGEVPARYLAAQRAGPP